MEASNLSELDLPYLYISAAGFVALGTLATWHAIRWRRINNKKSLLNKTYRSFGITNIVIGLFNLATAIYILYR
ncbi:hypothetical protein HYN59_14065 [Flavobacterium album]|uniref:Uncharacterized protein n=1 Tax=Flavobacterium album TaxID=2175091 RepID=A0A2S1R0F8_9FLAO|nr:hypothetical protein [Flavobacterium album]AWH86163.1 hypothetical protein HYN59_14065 [Flavobacterium album]